MGSVYRQKGRTCWMIKYYRDGRPIVESTGTDDKETARTTLKQREGLIAAGAPLTTKIGQVRFEDAAQDLINDYTNNNRRSLDELERRITKHLTPYFRNRRLSSISADVVRAFIKKRKEDVIVKRQAVTRTDADGHEVEVSPAVVAPPSNGEINRELTALKRIFSLAIESGKMLYKPHIPMLKESNVRKGFFELDAFKAVRAHLPRELQAACTVAYITGWRMDSEVLKLEWARVDFTERLSPNQQVAGTIRLDAGTTKNDEGRVFPMTAELRAVLWARQLEHKRLKKAGHITPWVFWRMVADTRGGVKKPQPIKRFEKTWKEACRLAGQPGRIPHDFRRTAVRNLVRAGVPERVAMQLTGHKTRSVFERYNIVSAGDLASAAATLSGQPTQRVQMSGRRVLPTMLPIRGHFG
jgi:integrase